MPRKLIYKIMIGKVTNSAIAFSVMMFVLNIDVNASKDYQQPCDENDCGLLIQIIATSKTFCGTPYRYGGTNSLGVDCSGLLQTVFGHHDLALPHSSALLRKMGKPVDRLSIQPGDLLFFKGRNVNSNSTSHVALVTAVCAGKIEIVHATRRGVVVDILDDEPYYLNRILEARRVIDYHQMESLVSFFESGMFRLPRM